MADPAGPAVRSGILGPLLVGITVVLAAGLLVLPLMMLVLGVLAALSTWFPALGDPTWNDGDAVLGLGFGGAATLALLAMVGGGSPGWPAVSGCRGGRGCSAAWPDRCCWPGQCWRWRSDRSGPNATCLNRP